MGGSERATRPAAAPARKGEKRRPAEKRRLGRTVSPTRAAYATPSDFGRDRARVRNATGEAVSARAEPAAPPTVEANPTAVSVCAKRVGCGARAGAEPIRLLTD